MSTLSREAGHSYLIRVILISANVLLLNAGCIGHHVTSSLIDVTKRSNDVSFIQIDGRKCRAYKHKLNFFKSWHTKVYKKTNST